METVEIILDNCRHLVRLLNDLLDLARSDAGRLAITPQPTEVAPLIDDAVRTMRAQTESAGQTLTQGIEPGSAADRRRGGPDSPNTGEFAYQRA